MNILEIKAGIGAGDLVLSKNKLYTKTEWGLIKDAEKLEEDFDLLQLTKKIQL